MRGHEPERLLAQPRRILLLEPLHLPRLPPEQGSLDLRPIDVIPGQLQLEHHLAVWPHLRPRRRQALEPVWRMDHEQTIALHLLQPDLGRILPPSGPPRDALRLFGERPLGKQL